MSFEDFKKRFKEALKKRIEKNTYKSDMTWIEKDGDKEISHMELVYIKRSRLPILGDWGRIYPPINEDDSIHWINAIFGGWKNLLKLVVYLSIIGFIIFGVKQVHNSYDHLVNLPCVQSCLQNLNPLGAVK